MDCVVSLRNKENETPQIVCAGNLGQSPQCRPCRSWGPSARLLWFGLRPCNGSEQSRGERFAGIFLASWLIEHAVEDVQVPKAIVAIV